MQLFYPLLDVIDMSLWLIGCGPMAQDYVRVLKALGAGFTVIGRNFESAKKFEVITGCKVLYGGLSSALIDHKAPKTAIVTVGVEALSDIAIQLIKSGTRRILLEKPGGLNTFEIRALQKMAAEYNAEVFIAYNRRFYASTELARKLVSEDGGVISCNFEFTEWSHVIAPLTKAPGVKETWFLANSTHVVDLVLYFCGIPKDWGTWRSGVLDWHNSGARYCGAGVTDQGILFNYHADWEAPGRWGVELMTRKRRFILRPMEQLQVIQLGSVKVDHIQLEDLLDTEFKPGLYAQTKAFLDGGDHRLLSVAEQLQHCAIYDKMAGYDQKNMSAES